ncbi:MAG: IS66 family transposase [Chloroflexia bacterium]
MNADPLPIGDPLGLRIAALEDALGLRDAQLASMQSQLVALQAELASREARIAKLETELAAAQRSAKRQATPFARRTRKPDPQKPGRRAGVGRFAHRPTPPEVHIEHNVPLAACPECAGPLTARRTHEQFQIDIPPVTPVVTRFVTQSGQCAGCGKRFHSSCPEQISSAHGAAGVVFGPRLKALATDMHHRFGASYGKIVELFRDEFGLETTRGGLSQADTRLAALAKPVYNELVEALRASWVVHADETGWRIGALSAWLWVFCESKVTVYTIKPSRGHEVILDILGSKFAGVLVSDCFIAYDAQALEGWLAQKCVAHLLRELREITETKRGRTRKFAETVIEILRDALVLKAGATDLRDKAYEAATDELEARLDSLLGSKRRWSDADNARLAKRLRKHREDVLRFLYWEELDATNNLAERQLRPGVLTRKTGGCNRTEGGAEAHSILASLLATCRQQAVSILDYFIALQQFGSSPPSLVPP